MWQQVLDVFVSTYTHARTRSDTQIHTHMLSLVQGDEVEVVLLCANDDRYLVERHSERTGEGKGGGKRQREKL